MFESLDETGTESRFGRFYGFLGRNSRPFSESRPATAHNRAAVDLE
jgi:hypothetical protein